MTEPSTEPISDLYSRRILELAGSISRIGTLENPHASATKVSRLCGSQVTVALKLENGAVSDFAHEVKACALGQAASSVMARHIVGSTPKELRALRDRMRAMLKEGGPPPEGKWSDLALLQPVRDYAPRHGSVMLTFEAVVDALDQIEGGAGG